MIFKLHMISKSLAIGFVYFTTVNNIYDIVDKAQLVCELRQQRHQWKAFFSFRANDQYVAFIQCFTFYVGFDQL